MIEIDELTFLSTSMSTKISSVTDHINIQQKTAQKYIHKFKTEIANRILNLEDGTILLENIFQINKDINLLMDHINEIEHVIFNTKLGVVPSDILTTEEFNYINEIESYLRTKVSLS